MTFSIPKLRKNSNVVYGGGGGVLPAQIACGTLVDPNIELDCLLIQDVTGSYGAAGTSFIRQLAPCIITAFPKVRLGLAYFADYPGYGGSSSDVAYGEQYALNYYTTTQTNTWTLPQLGGADEYESSLDAIQFGASSSTIGWRDVSTGVKKVIVLNTDTYPHEYTTWGSFPNPYTTRAGAVATCIANYVWPIYCLTSYSYYGSPYNLGYGGYGSGTPGDLPTLFSQLLSAIFYGIYNVNS